MAVPSFSYFAYIFSSYVEIFESVCDCQALLSVPAIVTVETIFAGVSDLPQKDKSTHLRT